MHNQTTIRKMADRDIEAVYEPGKQAFEFAVVPGPPRFWQKEQLRHWLQNPPDVLLVAEQDNQIVGFILSQLHQSTGKATVKT